MADLRGTLNVANIVGSLEYTEKPLAKLYLIINQGMGLWLIDLETMETKQYSNATMNQAEFPIYFHVDFNKLHKNAHTIVADAPIELKWLRSKDYVPEQTRDIEIGDEQFLWAAAELGGGYAIVIC